MKTNAIIFLSLLTTLILGSCSTSNEVVGGGIFQKRKYNDGVYWNRTSNLKESSGKNEKGLDIFKDEEKSSAKYVGSSSIYNESVSEIENITTVENSERVNDNLTAELSDATDATEAENTSLKTIENVFNVKNEKTANSQESSISESLNKPVPASNGNLMNILLIILLIVAIVILLSLLSGWIGYIISIVLTILIIYFLLKLLGIID